MSGIRVTRRNERLVRGDSAALLYLMVELVPQVLWLRKWSAVPVQMLHIIKAVRVCAHDGHILNKDWLAKQMWSPSLARASKKDRGQKDSENCLQRYRVSGNRK